MSEQIFFGYPIQRTYNPPPNAGVAKSFGPRTRVVPLRNAQQYRGQTVTGLVIEQSPESIANAKGTEIPRFLVTSTVNTDSRLRFGETTREWLERMQRGRIVIENPVFRFIGSEKPFQSNISGSGVR